MCFANFYWCFIWRFSKIAAPLNPILKTIKSSKLLAPRSFNTDDNQVDSGGGGWVDKTAKNLLKSKKSKNNKTEILMRLSNIGVIKQPLFLIFGTRKSFNKLKQLFTKTPIFQ